MVYVPNAIAFGNDAPVYRYLAIRELMKQTELPGMDGTQAQTGLPFATITSSGRSYRVKGIVTNRRLAAGNPALEWPVEMRRLIRGLTLSPA